SSVWALRDSRGCGKSRPRPLSSRSSAGFRPGRGSLAGMAGQGKVQSVIPYRACDRRTPPPLPAGNRGKAASRVRSRSRLQVRPARRGSVDPGGNMVSDELHRELQELYRIHDQMIAEARETEQAEQVHYKVSETPPRQQVSTFDETLVMASPSSLRAGRLRRLPHRTKRLTELEEAIAELRTKLDTIAELKGRLDAVLMLLGQGGAKGGGEVITLPNWRGGHVAGA